MISSSKQRRCVPEGMGAATHTHTPLPLKGFRKSRTKSDSRKDVCHLQYVCVCMFKQLQDRRQECKQRRNTWKCHSCAAAAAFYDGSFTDLTFRIQKNKKILLAITRQRSRPNRSPSPRRLCAGPRCSGRSGPWPAWLRGTAAGSAPSPGLL